MQALRTALVVLAAGLLVAAAWPRPADPVPQARDRALDYLAALPPGTLAPYVLEAAVAAGKDPRAWPPGHPALDAVQLPPNGTRYLDLLRPAFALSRMPGMPERDAIYNRIVAGYDGRQFGDAALLDDDSFALWTLSAIVPDWGLEPWHSMPQSLLENQTAEGGWSWAVNGTADTDSTGIALSALMASRPGAHVPRADAVAAFLRSAHNADGGFAAQPGGPSNCDSTVWGLRAAVLVAADAPDAWRHTAGNSTDAGPRLQASAWSYLLGLQRGDGGFAYQARDAGSNALCSAEAAILLAEWTGLQRTLVA